MAHLTRNGPKFYENISNLSTLFNFGPSPLWSQLIQYHVRNSNSKFGQHMAPLTLVANLATRWRHLHWLRIWPPDGTTCINSKVGHKVTSHALPHCLGLPYWHYQLVLSLYLLQPGLHQLSLLTQFETLRSDPKAHVYLGPIKTIAAR